MKKVLFVADSLSTGGLEKSLITLLKFWDYDEYDVDLYLFSDGRALLPELNKKVNLLPDSPYFHDYYNTSLGRSLITLAKKGKISLCFRRILRMVKPRFFKLIHRSYIPDTPSDWNTKKKTMLRLDTHYDVAIGFAEGSANHYVADCVDAEVKIGWVHTDVSHTRFNVKQERNMLLRLDHLVTVSENSKKSLLQRLPELDGKIHVLPNLLDTDEILEKAQMKPDGMDTEENCTKIVSVGRLVELKGFHLCPAVCRMLREAGHNVHWYIVGEGEYRAAIEKEIRNNHVEDCFTLLGNRTNPYCYEYHADICVQPSSYEGKSVVIEEEKFFRKPIVVSDIGAFREVICDRETGMIAERSSEALYAAVKALFEEYGLRQHITDQLRDGLISNSDILNSIYSFINQ